MFDSKMNIEAVSTLTHSDVPHRRNASRPACAYHALQYEIIEYTYEIILCGCYARGPNPHAWANPRDIKNGLNKYEVRSLRSFDVDILR
jgi:hypothetical protein